MYTRRMHAPPAAVFLFLQGAPAFLLSERLLHLSEHIAAPTESMILFEQGTSSTYTCIHMLPLPYHSINPFIYESLANILLFSVCVRRYGDCFRTNIFGQTHVFISRTDVARSLLGSESLDFSKRYIKSIGELLGHHSMLSSSHENHSFLRRHISNLFTFESLASFVQYFDVLTVHILKQWESKKHVVVFDDAMKVTFQVLARFFVSVCLFSPLYSG
jgi:Cytochrome P450